MNVLLILRESAPARGWDVVASMPPRIVVVRVEAAELGGVRTDPAVAAVVTDAASAVAVQPPLSEAERLFVSAFAAQGAKAGPRPGEGLAWDAPGFEPPR